MRKLIKILFIGFFSAFFLTACGPSEREIKNLGFSSAAEMKEIQAKGFKTKQDYEAQVAKDEAKAKAEREAREKSERQARAAKAIKVFKQREWVSGWKRHVLYLNIQSVTDSVTIQRIVLNRGRCRVTYITVGPIRYLPIQLNFGETAKVDLENSQCDLIEVQITTNLGTTTHSF